MKVELTSLLNESTDPALAREIAIVQDSLNLKAESKAGKATNLAVNNYKSYAVRQITALVDQGCSFAHNDYYIYSSFDGKPAISKSPNGMIRAMNHLAAKAGLIANINVGCVFDGYEELKVTRNGHIDDLLLVNSPGSEIDGAGDIIAPYAVITLLQKDGTVFSRKVVIVRRGEYLAAKSKAKKGNAHTAFPVPMAQKIPLRRAAIEMIATLGLDDSSSEELEREIRDHDADYDIGKPVHQSATKSVSVPGKNNIKGETLIAEVKKIKTNTELTAWWQQNTALIDDSGASKEILAACVARKGELNAKS